MESALILPTEYCVESVTIKRALLNYRTVFLKHPEDRDFVNGNDIMSIFANTIGISGGGAPLAKPLGKEKNHNLKFEKILSEFKPALDEGSLVLLDKPKDLYYRDNILSAGYHIDQIHREVFWNYRYMVASENYIRAASRGLNRNWLVGNNYDEIAPIGGDDSLKSEDERLNTKIEYPGQVASEEERHVLTRMVHARIASIARNIMLCHLNGFTPFTTDIGYSSVIQQMQSNFSTLLEEANDGSIELSKLDLIGKVERVLFSEFLDQKKINDLSVKDTLKCRTSMFGKYNENKTILEETLLKIALDSQNIEDFEKRLIDQFDRFLKANQDYVHERWNLGIKIFCNIGAVASSLVGPAVIQNFISAPSLYVLMYIAGPLTFQLAEKRIPEVRTILKQQKEIKSLPAYCLYNYFKPIL